MPGGRGDGGGQGPSAGSTSVRRADEVIERGLRLYASGDLDGALVEWRRALEIDRGNRRGRDYVAYVEDHYDVLNETFRAARERRTSAAGPAIEIEADDPSDVEPYESMVFEAQPATDKARAAGDEAGAEADRGHADDGDVDLGDGDDDGMEPGAPSVRGGTGAPGGKLSARQRPWLARQVARELDELWTGDESWPGPGRSNDTIEMALDPRCLDDLDEIAIGSVTDDLGPDDEDEGPLGADGADEGDGADDAGADEADGADEGVDAVVEVGADADAAGAHAEPGADAPDDDRLGPLETARSAASASGARITVRLIDDESDPPSGSDGRSDGRGDGDDADEDDHGDGREPGTGEITLPATRLRPDSQPDLTAEGSGPHEPIELRKKRAAAGRPNAAGSRAAGPSSQLDLSDFAAPRSTLSDEEARAEEEAWADGTPVVAGSARAEAGDDELREVRVTFRRPSRGMTAVGDAVEGGEAGSGDDGTAAGEVPPRSGGNMDQAPTIPPPVVPTVPTFDPMTMADTLTGESDPSAGDDLARAGDLYGGYPDEDLAPAEDLAAEELPPDDDLGATDDLQGEDLEPDENLPTDEIEDLYSGDDVDEDERTSERRVAAAFRAVGRGRAARRSRRSAESSAPPLPADADALLFGDEAPPGLRPRLRNTNLLEGAPTLARGKRPAATETDGERLTKELQGRPPVAHSAVSIELVSSELMAELDAAMAGTELAGDDHVRERVGWLIERAERENREGRYPSAVVALDLALDENPESAVAQKLIHSNRDLLYDIYGNYLGDMDAVPRLAVPMTAIPELDHRAAFLLSRVDGMLCLEDMLDVSGMARLEAFRHLSRLMLRGILEIPQ
ncbi:MAG TPA: hypothetical protein VK698_11330 [Kofleriaceae bacterium]|nr:hypothetical protein [Kofleriaceae bacterium]